MDITIFAWIFVIIFFLIYTAVQATRCCKAIHHHLASKRAGNSNTDNEVQISTVENESRQLGSTQSSRISSPLRSMGGGDPNDHSDRRFYFSRTHILPFNFDELKKDDGLPTYEEATATDRSNTSGTANSSLPPTPPPGQAPPAAAPSSVAINVEDHIAGTSI